MQVELVDIQCAMRSVNNVLISGGDCAARSALARLIHAESAQRHRPLIALGNRWTSQPPKGSTLFIEELTALEEPAQDELMRLLSIKHPFAADIGDMRIISGTAHNLSGPLSWPFNLDLFYRLNVIHVALGDQMPLSDANQRESPLPAMVH